MNPESDGPRTSARLWVRTASVQTQANKRRERLPKGSPGLAYGHHDQNVGLRSGFSLSAFGHTLPEPRPNLGDDDGSISHYRCSQKSAVLKLILPCLLFPSASLNAPPFCLPRMGE